MVKIQPSPQGPRLPGIPNANSWVDGNELKGSHLAGEEVATTSKAQADEHGHQVIEKKSCERVIRGNALMEGVSYWLDRLKHQWYLFKHAAFVAGLSAVVSYTWIKALDWFGYLWFGHRGLGDEEEHRYSLETFRGFDYSALVLTAVFFMRVLTILITAMYAGPKRAKMAALVLFPLLVVFYSISGLVCYFVLNDRTILFTQHQLFFGTIIVLVCSNWVRGLMKHGFSRKLPKRLIKWAVEPCLSSGTGMIVYFYIIVNEWSKKQDSWINILLMGVVYPLGYLFIQYVMILWVMNIFLSRSNEAANINVYSFVVVLTSVGLYPGLLAQFFTKSDTAFYSSITLSVATETLVLLGVLKIGTVGHQKAAQVGPHRASSQTFSAVSDFLGGDRQELGKYVANMEQAEKISLIGAVIMSMVFARYGDLDRVSGISRALYALALETFVDLLKERICYSFGIPVSATVQTIDMRRIAIVLYAITCITSMVLVMAGMQASEYVQL